LIVPAVGISSAAVVAGVAMAAQLRADDGQAGSSAPTTVQVQHTPSVAPTLKPNSAVAGAPDAVRACVAEVRTAEAVVVAARIAASHWREHVQAQTDLIAGKNTDAETKAIWKRTRLAGPADMARWDAATAQLQTQGGCARLAGRAATTCSQRSAALDAAAIAGRATAKDWGNHLAMMTAHGAGDFGAIHAQQLWIDQWKAAPKNLDAFAQADAALSKAPACRPS
jgi:hypothetical protein